MRSREYRARETASRPPGAAASAQPLPHNPRKQRKNPATAGSGERFRKGKWRRRRDSNPRDGFPSTPLAGERLRPLGHVSADRCNGRASGKQGGNWRLWTGRAQPRVTQPAERRRTGVAPWPISGTSGAHGHEPGLCPAGGFDPREPTAKTPGRARKKSCATSRDAIHDASRPRDRPRVCESATFSAAWFRRFFVKVITADKGV